jgi:hypothetical protein
MEKEEQIEKLQKFIIDNNLSFNSDDSTLNSECCIISGFALHIGLREFYLLEDAIDSLADENEDFVPYDYETELRTVFYFAKTHNYGTWWSTPYAKEQYKF